MHGARIVFLLTRWSLLTFVVQGAAAAQATDHAPRAPHVAPADQKFVTWVVRRTLEQYLMDGSTYALPHRPAHLAELRCQVVVTLRQGGRICGVGVSPPASVLEAAQRAAVGALKAAAEAGPVEAEAVARMRLELEVLGEVVPAPIVPYWGSAQSYTFLQPGVHGIVLQWQGATGALRPSEFISTYTSVSAALRSLTDRMNPGHESHQGMLASWFRTTHWHELEPGGEVVQLQRGLVVLPPEAVTERGLTEAVRTLAEYIIYRQQPEGQFSYQYEPSADAYTDANNFVRQADAAWGLARYAQQTGDPVAGEAAEKALRFLLRYVTALPEVEGAGYFLGPDGSSDLGATALLCLALTDHPQTERWHVIRDELVLGMLWLQQPSGAFITVFPPALVEGGRETFPGQALLALARAYPSGPQDRMQRAFEIALSFYREEFRKAPQAESVAWQTPAFALMARRTGRRDYAELVFEMNDWLTGYQLQPGNCDWPELHGAINPPGRAAGFTPADRGGKPHGSPSTAVYLEGLAEALALAREVGDTERAERYGRAVRAAARFVMQLQFRREEGFYVRSPIDCFNGVRYAPWDSRIRIDHCSRALSALTRAREVLFSEPRPSGSGFLNRDREGAASEPRP
ncbi:MAG: AMMECR1 domain-containing protein [Planctomycetota bacterium]